MATRVTAEEAATLHAQLVALGTDPWAREQRQRLEETYDAEEAAEQELHEFVTSTLDLVEGARDAASKSWRRRRLVGRRISHRAVACLLLSSGHAARFVGLPKPAPPAAAVSASTRGSARLAARHVPVCISHDGGHAKDAGVASPGGATVDGTRQHGHGPHTHI